MATSLIRSRSMITHAVDRHSWNELPDGAVLQEDGVIAAVGSFADLQRRHPNVNVIGSGQGDPASRLHKRPSPCRPDAGAARLARHAAGALVRQSHGGAQPEPVSRHAGLRLRDDRLRHHDGAAHPWLDAAESSTSGDAGRRADPGLRGCRHARVVFFAVRDRTSGVSSRPGLRRQPAAELRGPSKWYDRPRASPWRIIFALFETCTDRISAKQAGEDPVRAGQSSLVLRRAIDSVGGDAASTTCRCTCTCSRPPIRRNTRAGGTAARPSVT